MRRLTQIPNSDVDDTLRLRVNWGWSHVSTITSTRYIQILSSNTLVLGLGWRYIVSVVFVYIINNYILARNWSVWQLGIHNMLYMNMPRKLLNDCILSPRFAVWRVQVKIYEVGKCLVTIQVFANKCKTKYSLAFVCQTLNTGE